MFADSQDIGIYSIDLILPKNYIPVELLEAEWRIYASVN